MNFENQGFEGIITAINKQLEEETVILDDLKTQTAEAQTRVTKLQRAARDLADTPKPRKRDKSQSNNNWTPRPENIEEVLSALAAATGPLTIKQIESATGRSHSHTDSVIRHMRKQEMVRLAGRRGMANVYAPMSNGQVKDGNATYTS